MQVIFLERQASKDRYVAADWLVFVREFLQFLQDLLSNGKIMWGALIIAGILL